MFDKLEIKSEELGRKDESRWNNLLNNSVYGSYAVSMTYEYIKKDDGREISTHIFQLNGEDIAGAHYSFKRSQSSLFSTADILSGFIFKEELNENILSFLLSHFLASFLVL